MATAGAAESGLSAEDRAAIANFESSYGFPFDPFQRRACEALLDGSSVLVAAPTGAGKTVVGEFAAALALGGGGKTFYTTPIKALSNQKFSDFAALHDASNVGLLTGDNSINGNAPIVVMTTEVLRNMIYEDSATLRGLRYVVLDEVHYLQDPYRGAVWEEILIHLPVDVRIVSLSATVSNTDEFAEWLQTLRGRTEVVIEEQRPIEIRHLFMSSEGIVPLFVRDKSGKSIANPAARDMDRRKRPPRGPRPRRGGQRGTGKRVRIPYRADVVEALDAAGMLPAIYFIFSRKGCAAAVKSCLLDGVRLTSREEQEEIRRRAEERVQDLSPVELDVLGYENWIAGLVRGVASHHAGMIPPFKEVVEDLFSAGLVKAVFATETLALGVNMPARSVVMESLMKFNGERHELITPGQFTQLTGRAGRRGKDEIGHAVVLLQRFTDLDTISSLATTTAYPLKSSFVPSYNMAVNLVRNYDLTEAEHLVNSSFAQFQSDRGVVKLEASREELTAYLATYRDRARCERGDFEEYRTLQKELKELTKQKSSRARTKDVSEELTRFRPGDVIEIPTGRKKGRYAIVEVIKRRSERHARVLAMTPKGSLIRFSATDLPHEPTKLGHLTMLDRNRLADIAERKAFAVAIRDFTAPAESQGDPDQNQALDLSARLDSHPVAKCHELGRHIHFAERAARLEKEVKSIDRRIARNTGTLAHMFDQVVGVLVELGYVRDWQLTAKGEVLTKVYNESDLLVVEAIQSGMLEGLTPSEIAAVCSGFIYETRGPEGPPAPEMPTSTCSDVWRKLMKLSKKIRAEEEARSLDLTREIDPGFAVTAYEWADGRPLEEILEEDAAPGDFVRTMKQLIDLLRQVHDIVPPGALDDALSEAIECVHRGVVAYSSLEVT